MGQAESNGFGVIIRRSFDTISLLPVSAHAETGNKPLSDSVDQTSMNDEDDREVTQDERSEKEG